MKTQSTLTAAIVVIGNEILSGRTQDTNIAYLANQLKDIGIDLLEVRVVRDDEDQIIQSINELKGLVTYLFTTGGIGFTHDDITFKAIAKAFNRKIELNQEVVEILKNHYGEHFNDSRKQMALMPEDIILIDNPVSKAPSFQIENVFALAGMPSVMQGMFQTLKPKLQKGPKIISNSVKSNLVEGIIAHDLEAIQNKYPSVAIGSYPFFKAPPDIGTVLVIQGRDVDSIIYATQEIIDMIVRYGGHPEIERQV